MQLEDKLTESSTKKILPQTSTAEAHTTSTKTTLTSTKTTTTATNATTSTPTTTQALASSTSLDKTETEEDDLAGVAYDGENLGKIQVVFCFFLIISYSLYSLPITVFNYFLVYINFQKIQKKS